jgi:chromosome segregation ATPase
MELVTNIVNARPATKPATTANRIAEASRIRENALLRQKYTMISSINETLRKEKEDVERQKVRTESLLEETKVSLSDAYTRIAELETKITELTDSLNAALAKKSKKDKKHEQREQAEQTESSNDFKVEVSEYTDQIGY